LEPEPSYRGLRISNIGSNLALVRCCEGRRSPPGQGLVSHPEAYYLKKK
jgi:hypothetical protein